MIGHQVDHPFPTEDIPLLAKDRKVSVAEEAEAGEEVAVVACSGCTHEEEQEEEWAVPLL